MVSYQSRPISVAWQLMAIHGLTRRIVDAAGEDITHTVLTGHAFRLLAPAKSSGYVNVQFHRFVRLPIRGLR